MDIQVSEDVQAQLDQVKEWMESKTGREVTYNDVIAQILKNFQSVLYPEDLGSA
jgi:predicted transcriptional regulator